MSSTDVPADRGWSPARRLVASVLVALHTIAVFVAPLAFACRSEPGGPSPVTAVALSAVRPYIDFMYLHHGYFFFAPNPGASHLVRYRVEFDDGRDPIEQVFPDLERHWPRLLYHRHFMLSESLTAGFVPPEPPGGLPPAAPELEDWRRRRAYYEMQRRSYEHHLMAHYGADRVELVRVEHRPPTPPEFLLDRFGLDDPRLYTDLSEDAGGGESP